MDRSRIPTAIVGSGRRWGRLIYRAGTQTTSTSAFLVGFVPWLDRITQQIGSSEAEQMLCSGGFNVAQLVVVGLVTISGYFLLKAVVRALNRQVRGGIYSLVAAVVPLFVPAFLTVIGVDTACLFPW